MATKLIAKQTCNFGKRFYIGEEIPVNAVLDPHLQEKRGVLVIVNDDEGAAAPAVDLGDPGGDTTVVHVVIHSKDGDIPLDLTPESLQTVVDVLTGTAEGAEAIIQEMTDNDALVLIHAGDQRKTVKAAAEKRGQALSEAQEGAESEGEQ